MRAWSRFLPPIVVLLVLLPGVALAQWSPDFRVTTDPAPSRTDIDGGRNVAIAADSVGVVWMDTRDGNPEIYFRERIGATWGAATRLTSHPALSFRPAIGRAGSEIRVVWEDWRSGHAEIWTKRRIAGAWSADSCLTCDTFESSRPSMSHEGRHVVWEDLRDGNREIYYQEREAGGTWLSPFRVSSDAAESSHPSVASSAAPAFGGLDPVFVVVAWQDTRDGNEEIYVRYRDPASWDPETRISFDSGASRHPSAAVQETACGDVAAAYHWVVWQDDRHGDEEIYVADGFLGGWQVPGYRMTTSPAPALRPSTTRSHYVILGPFGAGLCPQPAVAWHEAGRVMFQEGPVGSPVPISDLGSLAADVSIASRHLWNAGVLTQTFEVVWTDLRDANEEIYTTQGISTIDATPAPEPTATAFRLGSPRPNPFESSTTLPLTLDRAARVETRVFDAAGREVHAPPARDLPAGTHHWTWKGEGAAPGVYFARVTVDGVSETRVIVRLR